jgi:hypothetical protein
LSKLSLNRGNGAGTEKADPWSILPVKALETTICSRYNQDKFTTTALNSNLWFRIHNTVKIFPCRVLLSSYHLCRHVCSTSFWGDIRSQGDHDRQEC